ncbi:carboxymuconolactone decarboxylase family protein [Aliikangiella coralliicola]|uniref:Carboxymuconolactone decarboxylase family protein n=1 Tax=Aliikangiella coralliicola TaxID=2592383 RepID=A0A545UG33_9GAMM|nr:carboxymuconolactone decarboxylase family protein [Aliikangiella coralliicola]TQV88434.1 carboxymuconolactone decarboxylase family protein [Aliikangiella coralliicola]
MSDVLNKNAPEDPKVILKKIQSHLGFTPYWYANLSESPVALEAYISLAKTFEKSSLNAKEQQIVLLTTCIANQCDFCFSTESFISTQIIGLDHATVEAIQQSKPLDDPKLNALADFTRHVVTLRGKVYGEPLNFFLAAGYQFEQALDVIIGVSLKNLSNYANHMTDSTFFKSR